MPVTTAAMTPPMLTWWWRRRRWRWWPSHMFFEAKKKEKETFKNTMASQYSTQIYTQTIYWSWGFGLDAKTEYVGGSAKSFCFVSAINTYIYMYVRYVTHILCILCCWKNKKKRLPNNNIIIISSFISCNTPYFHLFIFLIFFVSRSCKYG